MLVEKCKLKLTAVFLIAVAVVTHVNAQSSCTTIRKKPGLCVPKLACGTITELLYLWKNTLPPQVIQFIELSQCDTFNDVIYVCCERNRVTSAQGSQTQVRLTPTTPRTTSTTEWVLNFEPDVRPSVEKSDADIQSGMAILQATECGKSDAAGVANGNDAILSEYPWMALLVYYDGKAKAAKCTGSLITDRYVLTAAHCLRNPNFILVSVRLGEHNINETIDCTGSGRLRKCAPPVLEVDVEEAIYHKDHHQRQRINDIALVRLIKKAIFNNHIQPVCLPITPELQATTLDRATATGWAMSDYDIDISVRSNVLQKAVVEVVDNDYCQRTFKLIPITDKQLCALGGRNVITVGTSGGPLFISANYSGEERYVEYGIISYGVSPGNPTYYNVFASVISYLPWIAGNLRP